MTHTRSLRSAVLAVSLASSLASFASAAGATDPTVLHAPVIEKLQGGLKVANLRFNQDRLFAYPLISPPVVGFTPIVAVTLTDRQGPDDLQFSAIPEVTRAGNLLPRNQPEYTYLATLDSGGQSHILSAEAAAAVDLVGGNRDGMFDIEVVGASGSEFLTISDPLGVYVSGVQNISNPTTYQVPANNYVGQIHTSVLTAESGSVLPSIIGVPMFGHYAANIRNSQTKRLSTPDGAVRTPSINFVAHGTATQYQFKLALDLQDPLGASTSAPTFIPSFNNFDDFSDDPSSPTFWTFPIANTNLSHTGGSLSQQEFLFDTGAQVSVVSEATADAIGFDVGTDTPDFFVEVLGVGGISQAPGFFISQLELPVTGGSAIFTDVPVLVLNVTDPRDGIGFVPGIIGMNLFNDRDLSVNMQPSNPYVSFSAPITPQWNQNSNGTWLPDANWDLGVPDGTDVQANFLGAITAARTITVDGNYTIGSMKFDNLNAYTIAGNGRLTFEALGRPAKIDVVKGSHTVSAPLTLHSQTTVNVASGAALTLPGDHATATADVTKTGSGQLRLSNARYKSLTVNGGSVQIISGGGNGGTSKLTALSITGGTLDLTDSKLVLDYTGASPIAGIRADLAAGKITSSLLTSNKAIGYGEASVLSLSTFGGQTADATSLLLRMTLKGDTNLSGSVNFSDLLTLAQNYGASDRVWTQGDFDYNGTVNFADLLALAQNYGGSLAMDLTGTLSEAFAADWALALSLVPEPATLGGLAMCTVVLPRRRSRCYN